MSIVIIRACSMQHASEFVRVAAVGGVHVPAARASCHGEMPRFPCALVRLSCCGFGVADVVDAVVVIAVVLFGVVGREICGIHPRGAENWHPARPYPKTPISSKRASPILLHLQPWFLYGSSRLVTKVLTRLYPEAQSSPPAVSR